MEDKKTLRQKMLQIRNEIAETDRLKKNQIILAKLFDLDIYRNCSAVFTFLSMGSEVETKKIAAKALADGKRVALPVAIQGTRDMHFIEIHGFDGLVKSKYGAYEPEYNEEKILLSNESTLIIVPGCAFDKKGYRLGYGGGYYDTYIERNPSYKNIGVAYEEQLIDSLPVEAHDQRLDSLITDSDIYIWNN